MPYRIIKAPLIVDSDREFLRSIGDDPLLNSDHPLLAHDFESAVDAIRTQGEWISSLVVSPNLGSEIVSRLIRRAYEKMFGLPIFFLCDPARTKRDNEARAMATQQLLEKPLTYSEIVELVRGAGEKSKRPRADRGRLRPPARDEDFVPVSANTLMTDGALTMDVFVRLRAGRYVRVVGAGEPLELDRLTRYIKRGLKEFYLKKSEQDNYQRTCDHLTTMLSVITARDPSEKAS